MAFFCHQRSSRRKSTSRQGFCTQKRHICSFMRIWSQNTAIAFTYVRILSEILLICMKNHSRITFHFVQVDLRSFQPSMYPFVLEYGGASQVSCTISFSSLLSQLLYLSQLRLLSHAPRVLYVELDFLWLIYSALNWNDDLCALMTSWSRFSFCCCLILKLVNIYPDGFWMNFEDGCQRTNVSAITEEQDYLFPLNIAQLGRPCESCTNRC